MHNKDFINIIKNFYSNNNFSIREVAKIFNISKSTIHRWIHINNSNETNKINPKLNKINKYKKIIHEQIIINPLLNAKELQNIILEKTKIKISTSSIYIYIHQLGFTFKKIPKRNYTDKDILLKKQQIFENKIKSIKFKNIICIDESYFYSNTNNDYGWINIKNKSETLIYNKANPIKYTLIMAISCDNIVSYEIFKNKNIDQFIFYNFLKNKVFPICNNKYILMDNAKFHKTKIIFDLFKESKNTVLFIPPYSPQYNPIENVFGIIKNK